MRSLFISVALAAVMVSGCSRSASSTGSGDAAAVVSNASNANTSQPAVTTERKADPAIGAVANGYRGFDRNIYPGDDVMRAMHSANAVFAFTGYWITPPPGAITNSWQGKRSLLREQGWGFLVLANGRLDKEISKSQKNGMTPDVLGKSDAATAIAAAHAEGFPRGAILFLDQEEGGRLLDEQAAYLLAWTEAVAASDYKPGVYASGQFVQDDPGVMIDTVRDIRDRVKKGNLHEVAIFDAQDACPPAPGCTLHALPLKDADEPDLTVWQYSQSPRRPAITKACAATYASDGNCYAPGFPSVFLDMDVANSPDPSHGR